ncbi:lipocalin-like domain-containing protein [Ilumatobacter nonamiensis]|uniref:lipocalin-like domain-containing protein n=1 Tax=Ilumatobacter nonamiensis TaxID=467093 RepID=UPI0003480F54|nr:lipocalin-like domain-containing protein [Ilumatobacter nonamiensis]
MIESASLVGGWTLVEWSASVDGTDAGHPMGPDAGGQLTYTADGAVSAILHRAGRPTFGTRHLHQASETQRADAAATYVSYGGSYELRDDRVHHFVEHSLFPDWVGTVLVRTAAFEGDRLVLTALPERSADGRSFENRLVWKRFDPTTSDAVVAP